jgi:hypothetical protein
MLFHNFLLYSYEYIITFKLFCFDFWVYCLYCLLIRLSPISTDRNFINIHYIKRYVKRSISSFDNSLTRKESNILKSSSVMQQESNLCTIFFIKDFHCRHQQNKGRHNKVSPLVLNYKLILRALFRRDTRVQIPSSAYLPWVQC